MLDISTDRNTILRLRRREETDLPGPEALRQRCLHPAALWVLRRRARLPYRAPQRLPVVARIG
jgi:hypothetical protein